MTPIGVMQILGTAPVFASRAFLAGFLTALVIRFGDLIPFLGGTDALAALQQAPPWFTTDGALVVLGVLAALEAGAQRSVDARRVLTEVDPYVKLGVALVIDLGLVDAQSAALLNELGAHAGTVPFATAGFGGGHVVALAAAFSAFWMAVLRKRSLTFLQDLDEDDDIGLFTVFVWLEDLFVVGGVVLLAVFPLLSMVLLALTAVGFFAVDRWMAHRSRQLEVPCTQCQASIHASAPRCGDCGTARAPVAVGAFGQPRLDTQVSNHEAHTHQLIARRRCPVCATHIKRGTLQQDCPRCGHVTFGDEAELAAYVRHLQFQLPKTMLVCAAFGAIPLLGLVPGIVYYRLSLLGGLRRYLSMGSSIVTRWLTRLLNLLLIGLQWIPVIGAAMLPLLCLTNFLMYRRALVRAGRQRLAVARA